MKTSIYRRRIEIFVTTLKFLRMLWALKLTTSTLKHGKISWHLRRRTQVQLQALITLRMHHLSYLV